MQITLTDEMEKIVRAELAEGRCATAEDVVAEALDFMHDRAAAWNIRETEISSDLKAAMQSARESGVPFSLKDTLARIDVEFRARRIAHGGDPDSEEYLPSGEICARGGAIYHVVLRRTVDADNIGKTMSIDVLSGDYEIEERGLLSEGLRRRRPDAQPYAVRVGYDSYPGIGARPKRLPSLSD